MLSLLIQSFVYITQGSFKIESSKSFLFSEIILVSSTVSDEQTANNFIVKSSGFALKFNTVIGNL